MSLRAIATSFGLLVAAGVGGLDVAACSSSSAGGAAPVTPIADDGGDAGADFRAGVEHGLDLILWHHGGSFLPLFGVGKDQSRLLRRPHVDERDPSSAHPSGLSVYRVTWHW